MTNDSAIARPWNTIRSAEIARSIARIPSVYCGPASVVWIAAVWNELQGRPYDFVSRLNNKNFFTDGPRPFRGSVPGFQESLDHLLSRESNGELMLSEEMYFKCESMHEALKQFEMPVIIRMMGNTIKDGLHYATLYRSDEVHQSERSNGLHFYWQDNGLLGTHNGLSTGLYDLIIRGKSHLFPWGAKRVAKVGGK